MDTSKSQLLIPSCTWGMFLAKFQEGFTPAPQPLFSAHKKEPKIDGGKYRRRCTPCSTSGIPQLCSALCQVRGWALSHLDSLPIGGVVLPKGGKGGESRSYRFNPFVYFSLLHCDLIHLVEEFGWLNCDTYCRVLHCSIQGVNWNYIHFSNFTSFAFLHLLLTCF